MNLREARVTIRERGAAELVDLAFRVPFALNGGLYLRLSALTLLPALAIWGVVLWRLGALCAWICAVTLFVIVQGPFTIAASRLMFSEQVTLREVLGVSLRLSWRYLVAKLTGGLLMAGGLALVVLFPPAVARVIYLGEVTLLEGSDVGASYQRTMRLTRGRAPAAVALWCSLLVVALTFVLGTEILLGSLSSDVLGLGALSRIYDSGISPLCGAGLFVAAPFVATARFLAYIDSRTRREAWDLQVRFTQLAPVVTRAA